MNQKTNDSARTLRLCVLLESYFPVVGGMETQGRTLVSGLKHAGADVVVVTRRTSADLSACEQLDKVEVHRCGPTGRSSRNRWLFMLTCVPRLIRLRKQYDVLLVSGFRVLGITGLLVGKLFGKRVWLKAECMGEMSGAFFTGGLELMNMKKGAFLFRVFLAVRNAWLRKADCFISMYSEMDEEFKTYGVPENRITTIANAVDVTRFAPVSVMQKNELREKIGLPVGKRIFVYTGRIVSYKGVPLMLEIWNRIHSDYPDAIIVIVGEGGVDQFNCESQVRQFVVDQHLEDSVLFTGAVSNVDEYMKACDVFLLPTENDAFPLCIIEAMASALPIITTPVGALKDVIQNGVNGLLVEPGNAQKLQEAMTTLLDDPVLGERLGRVAMKNSHAKYTRTAIVEHYLELMPSCR